MALRPSSHVHTVIRCVCRCAHRCGCRDGCRYGCGDGCWCGCRCAQVGRGTDAGVHRLMPMGVQSGTLTHFLMCVWCPDTQNMYTGVIPNIHIHVWTSPAMFTLVDMCLPSPPTPCFSLVWVRGPCPVPVVGQASARPAVPGVVRQRPPVYPQVTSCCCSAPPSSGRCSWLSAPRNGSTWPAPTPTTWSLCGGSPTPCPTSFTVGGSRGVASLQSPVWGCGADGDTWLGRSLGQVQPAVSWDKTKGGH